MPLYIVVRDNPYWPLKTYVEDVDDRHVQAHKMVQTEDGAWRPFYPYGLLIPYSEVRDYLLRIQNRGVDLEGVRRCR